MDAGQPITDPAALSAPAAPALLGALPGTLPTVERALEGSPERIVAVVVAPGHSTADDAMTLWARWRVDPAFDPQTTHLIVVDQRVSSIDVLLGVAVEQATGLTDGDMHRLSAPWVGRPLDVALAATIHAVGNEVERARARQSDQRQAADSARTVVPISAGATALALLTAGAGLAIRRARRARDLFNEDVAAFRLRIDRLRRSLRDMEGDAAAERAVDALHRSGPHTARLVAEVLRLRVEVREGVDVVEHRISRIGPPQGAFAAGRWVAARAALTEPFAAVTDDGERTLAERLDVLASAATAARAGWLRALDGARAQLRTAAADLGADAFAEAGARLHRAGLPSSWLAGHPLWNAGDSVRKLDLLRQEDPIAYLEAVRTALAAEEVALDRVAVVLEEVQRVRSAPATAAGAPARQAFDNSVMAGSALDGVRDAADAVGLAEGGVRPPVEDGDDPPSQAARRVAFALAIAEERRARDASRRNALPATYASLAEGSRRRAVRADRLPP